jgi:hypothetical protein
LNRSTRESLDFRKVKLEWVNPLFSSTSGNVSKKRSVTRSISMKGRSRDVKKKCVGRNKKSICESKSVHIGDVPSSDTAGMRV